MIRKELTKIAEKYRNLTAEIKKYAPVIENGCDIIEKASADMNLGAAMAQITRIKSCIELMERAIAERKETIRLTNLTQLLIDIGGTFPETYVHFKPMLGETDCHVYGKYLDLYIIFHNIITNSIEATANINRPSVSLSIRQNEKMVMASITNNGPHIPAKKVDGKDTFRYIFGSTYTTKKGRSGRGLFTVLRLAQAHGCNIGVKNIHSGGVEFTVIFPANKGGVLE